MKLVAIVNNLPASLNGVGWVVARLWEGDLWYYDAWHLSQEEKARAQALEVEGILLRVEP